MTRHIFQFWFLTFFLCAFVFAGNRAIGQGQSSTTPAAPTPQATQAKFEQIAAQLEFFDLTPFLFNRDELNFVPAAPRAGARYFLLLNQVLSPEIPAADILPLCRHADPKVRTLALAALFQRNDPQFLPLIVELTGDTAPTFDGYTTLSRGWLAITGIGPPPQKQTVGGVAKAMAEFYLERAGYYHGIAGDNGKGGFAEYWAQRKARTFCASWFSAALARASHGISPTPPQSRADIAAVRKRIDALPAADRDWTLLYLNGEDSSEMLASEADLLEAAKRRGLDALLSVLHEKPPSDDPDLQGHDGRLMGWILARAAELLRPDMADDLLECERWQRDYEKRHDTNPYISAAWPVAAAQLQPERGREILKDAWSRFDGEYEGYDRASLMAALTSVGDSRDYKFVSAWLFAPLAVKGEGFGSDGKPPAFFGQLPRQGASPAARQFVARLIQDKRFDRAKFYDVKEAADLVNAWAGSPVIDIQKLFDAGWSGGEDRPSARAAIAAARDTLRQTSPQWSQ